MSQKKLLFVVNPKAGKSAIRNKLMDIIDVFSRANYRVEVHTTKSATDAEEYIAETGDRYDLIVCAGGDGSLENAVSGILQLKQRTGRDHVLGYIPCGSTNDYGTSLCISRDLVRAAREIVAGIPCPVDVGRIMGRNFIYIAAFGIFTEVSYATPQKLKKTLGHAAYLIEAAKSLKSVETFNIRADFDGRVVEGEFIYGQVTNSRSVGGFRIMGMRDMSFSDGVFECLLVRKPKNPLELERILKTLITNDLDDRYIVYERAKKVTIEGIGKPVPWTVDGECGGTYQIAELENLKRAVSISLANRITYGEPEDESLIPAKIIKTIKR